VERHKQFQLENEVDEMRAKLKALEDQLDQQKKSVSKILPSISESHKAILVSRTKCNQLSAVCVKVGKIVQGPSYQ
jgi:septal ring factor EnvC (AmiA/AmiB activator)